MAKKSDEFDAGMSHAPATPSIPPAGPGGTAPAHPASPTPVRAGDLGQTIASLRHLADDLKKGDAGHAWQDVKAILTEVVAALDVGPPLMAAAPMAASEPMKQCAARLEEFCQHAEGGTGHPIAKAATAGGWQELLMPLIMEVIQALLQRKKQPV